MASEAYTLQAFIADLDRITQHERSAEKITEQVAPLLSRLVKDPSSVPPEYLKSPRDTRGRYMLHRSPRFNVTSVIWRPGDTAGAHNHETWGVIGRRHGGRAQPRDVGHHRRHRQRDRGDALPRERDGRRQGTARGHAGDAPQARRRLAARPR